VTSLSSTRGVARCTWCCVAALAWLVASASSGLAQRARSYETEDRSETAEPAQAKPASVPPAPAAEAKSEVKSGTKAEDDLYILKDVEKPEPEEPKLDLGKVGKHGELSIEKMRGPEAATADEEGRPRGGAGVRLRIPLGKQDD